MIGLNDVWVPQMITKHHVIYVWVLDKITDHAILMLSAMLSYMKDLVREGGKVPQVFSLSDQACSIHMDYIVMDDTNIKR